MSGPNEKQIGYVLRKVNATLAGSTYTITTPEIARYCISGGKPGFSYDERWIAFHHYVTNADATALGFTGPEAKEGVAAFREKRKPQFPTRSPLRARLEADPKDHQARYDLALALDAKGDREGALDALLEIVRRDRKWNDEAARKHLVTLFEAMGPADPRTVAARRRLSSILFS